MMTTICSSVLTPRIIATAAHTGAAGIRSIHVAVPDACASFANHEAPRHQGKDYGDKERRGNVGDASCMAAGDAGEKANCDVAALDNRNRNATGDRERCNQ